MYIAYFDETGDDGFPVYSSKLFVLTSIYMHYQNWKNNYDILHTFRKQLKADYNLPVSIEFHTRQFVTDKNPYRDYRLSTNERREILFLYAECLQSLEMKTINVVINKKNIRDDNYSVLENALKYNVQRIENDLRIIDPAHKFMIITDEGRVGKMRKITRKIQRINYIPSKFNPHGYRSEIKQLIEDPLPKPSNESLLIQISDFISYFVFLYANKRFLGIDWPKRVQNVLREDDVETILNRLRNVLNLKASSENEFGVVHYPK